jgi:hypothetical protein
MRTPVINNPFFYGNPVAPPNFFNRRQPLRRIVTRLLSNGQSTAIVGEPRMGKTSLLHYLAGPQEIRNDLYDKHANQLLFSYLDAQTLEGQSASSQFWERVLTPVFVRLVESRPDTPLVQQYHLCRENGFGISKLEALFCLLKGAGWQLVLLLDEFDTLLHHDILNSAEFFGGLRSLASLSKGAFALVIASRLSLTQLNEKTKNFGSPFCNIFTEITLGPFPEKDVTKLLNQATNRFTLKDRNAIRIIAGGHPFLLQAAAAAMWDACEEGLEEPDQRRRYVGKRLYGEQKLHFTDTWRIWSPAIRKAFTTVALAHTAHLLPEREFLIDGFVEGLRDFEPELNDLESVGVIARDKRVRGGWRVVPQAMLWWLADELVRAVRVDTPFENWLRMQELDNLLTRKERDQLGKVMDGAVQVLRQGATTLVEAFAEGLGKGMAGGE